MDDAAFLEKIDNIQNDYDPEKWMFYYHSTNVK